MNPFTPLTLPSGSQLINRLAKAAMEENMADRDHAPSEALIRLYRTWAEGGAGLGLGGLDVGGQALAHGVGAMPDHHLDALRLQAARSVDHMPEHGLVGDRMQHLGQIRTHPRALAGGQNDDIQTHRKLLAGQELAAARGPREESAILPET